MADSRPQDSSREAPPSAGSVETAGGVSFVVPPKETPTPSKDPSRDEVSRELEQAGVTTENQQVQPPASQKKAPPKTKLRALRTFQGDVAEALKKTKGSKVSIKAAEEKRAEEERRAEKERQNKEREERRKQQTLQDEEKRLEEEKVRLQQQEEERLQKEKEKLTQEKQQLDKQKQKSVEEKQRLEQGAARAQSEKANRQSAEERAKSEERIRKERERIQKERERIAKEQKARQEKAAIAEPVDIPDGTKRKSKLGMFIASVLFIILGSGTLYGAYSLFFNEELRAPVLDIDTLVFAEESVGIAVDGLFVDSFTRALTEKKDALESPRNTIVNFYLTETIEETERRLSAPLLLSQLSFQAPEALARSVDADYMLGVHVLDRKEAFLILKPTFYENAFAGMLEWEETILENLTPFFTASGAPRATSVATTTSGGILESPFIDEVIENKDVRVLYDENGNVLLLYSFVDRSTLIITSNKETLRELVERMSAKRVSR